MHHLELDSNFEKLHALCYLTFTGEMGGILFSYIPWKVSLSGEVGGYPQALSEVVTLREC